MKNSMKGALLSGLVFPGVGQVSLKHYKKGIALILIASVTMLLIIVKAVQHALIILNEIQLEGGVIDERAILNATAQASTISDSFIFNVTLLLIILCWIVGVVDAYRIGKKKDIEERSTSLASNGD